MLSLKSPNPQLLKDNLLLGIAIQNCSAVASSHKLNPMKKILFLAFTVLAITVSFAQTEEALVFFADKENVEASLANPITILTQEALDRKYLHNIPIDERDVPLNETYKSTVSNQPGITVYAKSKWMNAVYVRGTKTNIENLLDLE